MRRVRWRRLELGGFGPYRRVVRVEFSSGMNVLVAPNERGKSTLVAGLLGVLYGLPEEGLERFRNWEEPAAFYGELEFEVDGVSYLLRRDFGRDEHALARRENGGWVEVASGRRQERGGRAAVIERLIGIGSPELFEATFCVRQPLPGAAQLDRLVERFVSGAGAGRYQAALEALEGRLRQITRFTADRGVGRLNLPRDGRLEALNARIGELSERVAHSRAVVDSLQAARERLQAASAERAAAEEELGRRRAAQAAWAEWRQHWRAYRIATDERRQAEGVLAAWEERSRAVAWMRDRLARAYAPFDGLGLTPEAAEGEIDRLIDAAEAVWEARRAADERADALAELKARRAALEDTGRTAIAALEADAAEIRRAIGRLRPWGEWGPHPTAELERIREQAAACQATWRELERQKARREELEAALRDRYGPLAELTEEARQALLALDARRRALEEAIRHAESELEAVRRQRAAFERERDAFERAFGDLIGLDDDAVGAVEALIRARQEEERLAGELEKIKRADREMRLALRRRRWAAAGTGAAVGIGVFSAAVGDPIGAGLWAMGLGLVAAAAVLGQGRRARRRIRRHRRLQWEQFTAADEAAMSSIAMIGRRLGAWGGRSLAELGELRQRLLQRRVERERLLQHGEPSAEREADLTARLEAARKARTSSSRSPARWKPPSGARPRAVAAWLEARRELAELTERLERSNREAFGTGIDGVAGLGPQGLRGNWATILRFAQFLGWQPPAPEDEPLVPALMAWYAGGDFPPWEGLRQEAARWEEETAALARAEEQRRARLERSAGELAEIDARIAAAAAEHARAAAEHERRRREHERGIGPLAGVWQAAGESPERLRQLYREWRALRERLAREEAALEALLATGAACGGDELRKRIAAAQEAAERSLAAARALEDAYPELAAGEGTPSEEAIGARRRELHARVEAAAARLAEAEAAWEECWQEYARIESADVVNIAAAEEELFALVSERDRLAQEAEELAIADRELVQAAVEFQTTYRDRLAAKISGHFQSLTGGARRVLLDESLTLSIGEPDGRCFPVSQLSQGARDQLFLAVRLAIADWVAEDVRLPFVLDDPFVNFDAARLGRMRVALSEAARERQVILLAHAAEFAGWGEQVVVTEVVEQSA